MPGGKAKKSTSQRSGSRKVFFARIDHATAAAEAGLQLRPTELIMFGNARGGTPLMQSAQTVGIDLPLKALVWEDAIVSFVPNLLRMLVNPSMLLHP